MKINLEKIVEEKMKEIIKGDLLSKLEIYDKERIKQLLEQYGNQEEYNYETLQVCLKEYGQGIKHIILDGERLDEGDNKSKYEEHIIIKNDSNIMSYSKDNVDISYLQMVNSNLKDASLSVGKERINRCRYVLYVGGKKRFFVESFREIGCDKVILERYFQYNNIQDNIENVDGMALYYNALEMPIYGEFIKREVDDKTKSNNEILVKEMFDLASQQIVEGLNDDMVYVKK